MKILKIINAKGFRLLAQLFLVSICLFSIFLYQHYFESQFYIKAQLYGHQGIFVIPVFFWGILFIYGLIYSKVFKQDTKGILSSVVLMGIGLQLLYFLFEMKMEIDKYSPFGNQGQVYLFYAKCYFLTVISIFFALNAMLVYKIFTIKEGFLLKSENNSILEQIIFYTPGLLFFLYIVFNFVKNIQMIGLFCVIASSIIALWYQVSASFKDILLKFKKIIIFVFKNEAIIVFFIFSVAFIIRYIWALRLLSLTGNNYIIASDDGLTYDPFAALIAQGRAAEIGRDALYWGGMGYWYFLALIYKIFGLHNFHALVVFQSLLGAFVPLCTYYIAKKIFDKTVAISATMITCFEMSLIFSSGVIGMEALFIPVIMATMAFLIYLAGSGLFQKKLLVFFLGLMFGLANAVRGEIIFFPFVLIFLIVLYVLIGKKSTLRRVVIFSACLLLGFFLGLIIQAFRNYIYLGEFTISTQQASVTFYQGGVENEILEKMGFNPFKDFSGSFWIFIKSPLQVIRLLFVGCVKRFLTYLFIPNFGEFDPFTLVNPASFPSFKYPVYFQVYVSGLIIFGIIFSFLKKRKRLLKSIILSYMSYTILIYSIIAPKNPRHRTVLVPFFIIFFVYGAIFVIKKLTQKQFRRNNEGNNP